MTGAILVAALAGSDCERISGGWWAQPANAASSLTYAAVGVWLLRRAWGSPASRALFAAAGVGLVAVGLGSLAYHGPQPGWAGTAHDASIVALLAVLVVRNGWLLTRHRTGFGVAYAAPCLAIAPALGVAGHDRLLLAALVVAAVVGASLAHRAGPAGRADRGVTRRLWSAGAAVGAVALVAYAAGRSASGFCRPESLWQPHALWHVASAGGLGLVVVALATPGQRPSERPTPATPPLSPAGTTARP